VVEVSQPQIIKPWQVAGFVFLGLICVSIVALAYVGGATTFKESESYQARTESCKTGAYRLLPKNLTAAADVRLLDAVSSYCYNDIWRADELGKSLIIRGMYIHQRYENNVILFVVVSVTLAGVGLAGLQLLTSYNLAASGRMQDDEPTTLSIERGKLSLRSSITGVVVLGFSLAFFFIYILEVYNIAPPPTESEEHLKAQLPTQLTMLPPGGLGPPPQPSSKSPNVADGGPAKNTARK
jgi:hypothetical protein